MLDLRFEAFNAFNTVNFGNPAATLSELRLRDDFHRGRPARDSDRDSFPVLTSRTGQLRML